MAAPPNEDQKSYSYIEIWGCFSTPKHPLVYAPAVYKHLHIITQRRLKNRRKDDSLMKVNAYIIRSKTEVSQLKRAITK